MAGSSRSLGTLSLDLVLKTQNFVAGMTSAERAANKSLTAIERRAYAFGRALGTGLKIGAGVAAAALGALTIAVSKAIDNADQIRDLSIRLGTSTETLSAFGYAAQQTGTDLDTLGRGMKILAKNATDALNPTSEQARVFDALGISVTDASGKLKDMAVLIPEIATAFQSLEDGTTKAALAQAIFGKAGLELTEFLNQGADGLAAYTEKARELGIVIDTETAAAADEFNDTLNDLKAIVSGGALTIARELLPALQETASDLKRVAQEGELAANAATVLSSALRFGVGVIDAYNAAVAYTGIALEALIPLMLGVNEAARNVGPQGLFVDGSVAGGIQKVAQGYKNAQDSMVSYWEEQDRRAAKANSQFADVSARVLPGASNVNQSALQRALSGQKPGTPKRGGAGKKSEEETEAENLKKAYDRQNESLARQIALFGETGEAAQLRYQIETEDLSKLDAASRALIQTKQAEALASAERIDQMELEKELGDAANKRLMEESELVSEGVKATNQLISDMEFELELIGKTNAEREKAIALRGLDANATEAQKEQVAGLVEELHRAEELQGFIDDFKTGLADAFVDFASGAKSAKDAWEDFTQQLFKRALQFVADQAIQMMFDSFSNMGSGSTNSGGGGFWAGLLSLFGGGKAAGGNVLPGMFYRVNESGMEMATVDGRDYLLTGSKSGTVTPANRVGGGSSVTQIFNNPVFGSRNSAQQLQQEAGIKQRIAMGRNG